MTLILCLSNGSNLVHLESNEHKYLNLLSLMENKAVNVLPIVPSMAELMLMLMNNKFFTDIELTFFCAEPLSSSIASKWFTCLPAGRVFNFYGLTETTILNAVHEIKEDDLRFDRIPIGVPIANSRFAINEAEQLIISGPQVFAGYLKSQLQKPAWNSGDRVHVSKQGVYTHLGRNDRTVQVMGHRISLMEIEITAKAKEPGVLVRCVKTDKHLLFLITNQKDNTNIKERIREELPGYMMPDKFVHCDDKTCFDLNNFSDKALLNWLAINDK